MVRYVDQHVQAELQALSTDILQAAKQLGATQAEVELSHASGFDVTVRLGKVETVEHSRDKGIGIDVYFNQRKGSASSTDTSKESIAKTLQAACDIAKSTSEDKCAGLADPEFMAQDYPDLDLYHPWDTTPNDAIELATNCEAQALEFDKRIVNSEGATVSSHVGYFVYANSHGFMGDCATSRHSFSCCMIAQDDGNMQRDYDFTVARDPQDLLTAKIVAQKAAERTLKRLGGKRIKTCHAPVIFAADIANGLLSRFIAAISGGNLYHKASFLVDHLDKQVFPDFITISEQPYLKKALGSAAFDAEGVKTNAHDLVTDGILRSYVLDSYSARRLGMKTTGNAGGIHNLRINTGDLNFAELIKKMHKGLVVTELMGHGVNIITGNYSQGASGFWVENGEIVHPVEEVTIAGNLRDMFRQLVAVGNDVDYRSNICSGSILLEQMTIAGE